MHLFVRRALPALLAALLLLAGASPAAFADAQIHLRVEGEDHTIFEGDVSTDGHHVDGRRCDGTNNDENEDAGPTMTSALDDGARQGGFSWKGDWNEDFEDFFIERIGPDSNDEATTSTGATCSTTSTRRWGAASSASTTVTTSCTCTTVSGRPCSS